MVLPPLPIKQQKSLQKQPTRKKSAPNLVFLTALVLFCIANVATVSEHYDFKADNSIWYHEDRATINAFNGLVQCPSILFMGSSMIRRPMWYLDYSLNRALPKYMDYHKTMYFENEAKKVGLDVTAFNLGVDGAYISDLYLLFDKLIRSTKHPDLIICAISEREFVANWLVSARATPVYKLLSDPLDYPQRGRLYSSSGMDWLDGLFAAWIPFRCYRSWYQSKLSDIIDYRRQETTYTPKMEQADLHQCEDIAISEKLRLYNNQKSCLEAMLSLARKRNIKILLVNLPLREIARRTISESVQTDYKRFIAKLKVSGVSVLDLAEDSKLNRDEYYMDYYHLNENGGRILVSALIERLSNFTLLEERSQSGFTSNHSEKRSSSASAAVPGGGLMVSLH